MTDPRIEEAARALYENTVGLAWPRDADDETKADYYEDARIALAAADAAAWRPIAEYNLTMGQVYCGHSEKKWLRHGRMIPGHGTRWYYSGTNERSQWAQQVGDEPTHFRALPAPPTSIAELGGADG